jgi:hypothetical protein
MAGPGPIVRQLIVCDRLTVDRDGTYHLTGPRVDFVVGAGDEFPLVLPELWVFAQVAGSFGRQHFHVRIWEVTDPTAPPNLVYESGERAIDLGGGPGRYRLRSRGWSVKLTDVGFPRPGRYELRMAFGDNLPGSVDLFVEGGT